MKENLEQNIFPERAVADKNQAYYRAKQYWDKKDTKNAEKWAIQAMRWGSRNLAPKLLANIAESTLDKNTALTLASYYWNELKDSQNALSWATLSKIWGSTGLADKLIAEITAHLEAIDVQQEVRQFSQ